MLIQFARNYAILGDTGKERADAEEAYHLLAKLAAAKPDDNNLSERSCGRRRRDRRRAGGARRPCGRAQILRRRLAIIERLAQSDPGNASRQHDLAVSYIKVGDVSGRKAIWRAR